MFNTVFLKDLNQNAVLVDRDQLRRQQPGRTLKMPIALSTLPVAPQTVDWSKSNIITFPTLGNDRVGNCFMTSCAHAVQCWTANNGEKASFDVNALVARYLKIAGGDNGLSYQVMMPEWRAGIIGPNGPHKILDEMIVPAHDKEAITLAMWLFGGVLYTAALLDAWLNPRPGQVWDAVGPPNPRSGHAMALSGINQAGRYQVQTWGLNPPVQLTQAGLLGSDPEIIVAFSLEWFNAQGVAPNGFTYAQLADYWRQLGGAALPPSPFGPVPPSPPSPPPPSPPSPPQVEPLFKLTFPAKIRKGQPVSFNTPVDIPAGKYGLVPIK